MCSALMFAPANKTLVGGEGTSFGNRRAVRLLLGLPYHVLYHPSRSVQAISMCSPNKVFSDPKTLSPILNSSLQGLTEYAQTAFVNLIP